MDLIQIAKAAESGVVGCTGSDCTICSILEAVGNVYNFITGISFAVAVLFLALSGLVYIFGTGRRSYFEKAKVFARNAILGFVFVLVGWIAIHAVLYSTGYKNAGNWWQFQCGVDSSADYQTVSLKSVSAYANLADFIASGNTQGVIRDPISDTIFLKQLQNLKPGEKLTFYLAAKKSVSDQKETMVPFLAGYKDENGNINIDALTVALLQNLAGGTGNNSTDSLSLLGSSGDVLSQLQSSDLVDKLFYSLLGVDTSNLSLDQKISMVRSGLSDMQQQNPITPGSDTISKAMNSMITAALDNSGEVLVNKTTDDSLSGYASSKNKSNPSVNSDQTAKDEEAAIKNNALGPMTPVNPNNWQKSISTQNAPTGSQTDNFGDLNKGRGQKPDELSPDDWNQGDGSPEAIKKALRRIDKRDHLRYEMIFRFVQHIGDEPGGGGLCTGCGDIYASHSARILDISHILVHEGTHSGHACTVGWSGFTMGELEAIACANQQGSLDRNKTPDMKEFPRNRETIQYMGKEVRGDLARFWTGVNPAGDLNTGILDGLFQKMTDYPKSKGYQNQGEYAYGWGTDKQKDKGSAEPLLLSDRLEKVVETVVTSQEPYMSCPPKDLPPLKDCNAPEIKID